MCLLKLSAIVRSKMVCDWEYDYDEDVVHAWGPDGKYYKMWLSKEWYVTKVNSDGIKKYVKGRSVKFAWRHVYTGDFADGPGGYNDDDNMSQEEWRAWKRGLNITKEEDNNIYGQKMNMIAGVFSSLLKGGPFHPEMLDKL